MSKLSKHGNKQFDDGDFIEKTQDNASNSYNVIDAIMKIEEGAYDSEEEYASLYQALIDSGVVWHLQGSHQRNATWLIANGFCTQENGGA